MRYVEQFSLPGMSKELKLLERLNIYTRNNVLHKVKVYIFNTFIDNVFTLVILGQKLINLVIMMK